MLAFPSCSSASRAETFGDRAGGQEFLSAVCELAVPGVLAGGLHSLKFCFSQAQLANESYEGINARCRYYVRVTISRSSYATGNISKDVDIVVKNVEQVRPLARSLSIPLSPSLYSFPCRCLPLHRRLPLASSATLSPSSSLSLSPKSPPALCCSRPPRTRR